MMGGTREPAPETVIKDKPVDPRASLPEGTLKGPFLDRQGDEQRQPSQKEKRERQRIQKAQNRPD